MKLAAITLFLGRGLQHFFLDTPYSSFFWDEELLGDFHSNWSFFVNDLFSDKLMDRLSKVIGSYFFFMIIIVLMYDGKQKSKWLRYSLIISSILIFIQAILYSKDKFFELPLFLEFSVQFFTPILILIYLFNQLDSFQKWIKIALAFTFVSHGLYALGIYPLPVHFMEMTMGILDLDEDNAKLFLKIAGIMDIIVSILLFTNEKWLNSALIYMTLWGLLTAFARTVYLLDIALSLENFFLGLPNTMMRLCHGLIPLALFLYLNHPSSYPVKENEE